MLAILRERALWLKTKGSDQWQGFIEGGMETVESRLAEGTVLLVERGGQDAACVAVRWADPFWESVGADGQAAWVHSLAVRRAFSGRGLGKALLAFVESMAKAQRKGFCRLDVLDANARLKAYYAALGYRERDSKPFQDRTLRLMEKTLR
jgi:GNAT superfamily N-acetyltransferase